ncbi:unnamed protein product, partial [Chrysoparadoxa australica]
GGGAGGRGSDVGLYGAETVLKSHAGSPPSPLLSSALILSQDATVSYWDGESTLTPTEHSESLTAYLKEVRMPTQALILDCHVRNLIGVEWSIAETISDDGNGDDEEAAAEDDVDGKCEFIVSPVIKMTVRKPKDSVSGQADILTVATVTKPDPDYFEKDLHWLRNYSDLRSDRLAEIYHQTGDIISFFGALGFLDNGRRKYTLLLLEAVRSVAVHVETLAKFIGRQKRPIDYAMEVQPMIQTPDHSSFPSGHALEAFAIATVLHRLSDTGSAVDGIRDNARPFLLAHRISTNRTVAGVHFPVDSLAGAFLGLHLGELIHSIATGTSIQLGELGKPTTPVDEEKTEDFLLS